MRKFLFIILVLSVLFGCAEVSNNKETSDKIVYEFTGDASGVIVTISNSDGGAEQFENVVLPKSYTFDNFKEKTASAGASSISGGSLTVKIIKNGSVLEEQSSNTMVGIPSIVFVTATL